MLVGRACTFGKEGNDCFCCLGVSRRSMVPLVESGIARVLADEVMNGLLAAGHHLKNNNIPLLQLAGFRTLARKPCDRSFALRRLWAQSLYLIAKNICCTFVQTIPSQYVALGLHVALGLVRGIRGQCWRLRAESIWSVFSIYLFSKAFVCNLVYFCVLAASNATVSIARASCLAVTHNSFCFSMLFRCLLVHFCVPAAPSRLSRSRVLGVYTNYLLFNACPCF